MPHLKRIATKWERYWEGFVSYDKAHSYMLRWRLWRRERRYRSPLDVEKYKFTTEQHIKLWPFITCAFVGATIYFVCDKIYQEARWLREPGSPIMNMNAFSYIIYWHARIKATLAFAHNFNLQADDKTDPNAEKKDIEATPRKEKIMRALQVEQYKKNRIDTFDFAYIGETEDFSLVV